MAQSAGDNVAWLEADLATDPWDEAQGALRTQSFYESSLYLYIARR